MTVLENGETWGVYTSGGYIVGALTGNTTTSGSHDLQGNGKDFNLLAGTVTPGSYSGTFSAKDHVSVKLSNGTTFTGNYRPFYDQPASLTELAGTFSGQVATGSGSGYGLITISSSGAISIPEDRGCKSSGTVKPRASGKNVFDLSVTFSGSTCVLGNGTTVRGIAVYDNVGRSLLGLALNGAKSDGFIYFGTK
ncbi:MAG: hypothetical protein WA917_09610 [Comamonas sp.]